ncbi:MBL fold metallo-hydrolase [Bythopirellula polymerisocia]|uniref:Ribonuclease BN n=1 Tax=Bythopirellula polymerisocia TaxID=2528003 RepID=A0A5C6CX27_9BACT|nr:MBL fold metallo-hydrolase [Bythopirellula polymerisocia]TWU29533.1 Ribonuclease BN [Bythopirellula polymerisocia]
MKLVLLGTSGYHPNDRRQTACLMLPELGVVFDAGTAMYRVSDYLSTDTLDVYLSHAHLDHVMGLTFMFDILSDTSLEKVIVHGETEKLKALREHLFTEMLFPVDPPFEMRPLQPKYTLADGGVLTHFPLRHPGGSVGYRIDWPDRSLAYVTDTVAAPDVDYIEHIRGADLLVHECFFDDTEPAQAELTGHSCITPVAQVAKAAEVGRLVLVHINPVLVNDSDLPLATAQKIFPKTEIGTDFMVLDF